MLYNAGITSAQQLTEQTGCSRATVFRVIKRIRDGESLERKEGSGRQESLAETDRRRLGQLLRWHPRISVTQLADILAANRTPESKITVRRELVAMGYVYCRRPRGPMTSARHKENRVQWCMQRQEERTDWQSVVFAEECQEYLHGNLLKVWRRKSPDAKCPIPSQSPG